MIRRCLLLLGLLAAAAAAPARDHVALLGTYAGAIYTVRLDADTGALSAPAVAAELPNPEFLALHPNGRVVYAATQAKDAAGKSSGAVAAFAVEAAGHLTPLNVQATGRGGLVHLAADPSGRMLVAPSYGGGCVASFPLAADGRLGPVATVRDESGPLGPDHARQEAPHPHSVTVSPDGRFAFVADLGVDRVFAYALQPADGTLAPHEPAFASFAAGTGPRHTKFSPDGKFFYVLGELDGTITSCRYDAAAGRLTPFARVSIAPDGYTGRNSGSEIRVHPNGRFVYAANRGNDTIAVFARDPDTGALTRIGVVPCGGAKPRNFNLTPDGAWLLCANQDANTLTVLKVDPASGRLELTAHTAAVPKCVCVLFLP